MTDSKRIAVYLPMQLVEQVDDLAQQACTNRSELIREAMRRYLTEQRKFALRNSMQQGYVEMARINLRIASEAFLLEEEAGGTVERLVSGV